MEKLEALSEDIKYLMLCQRTPVDIEQLRKGFKKCTSKDELLALEESLGDLEMKKFVYQL